MLDGTGSANRPDSAGVGNADVRPLKRQCRGHKELGENITFRRCAFELPENVSRKPAASRALQEGGQAGTKLKSQVAVPDQAKFGSTAGDKKNESAGVKSIRQLLRQRQGPARAAARKRKLHLAKTAVSRRVALWRSRIVDGDRETVYVTLGGEAVVKGAKSFRQATADKKYLKSLGIAALGSRSSKIDAPEEVEPYKTRRNECLEHGSKGRRSVAYWCVPECVQAGYRDVGVRELYEWQAQCLSGEGVAEGRSLVYVAPTSAGKSLVSEVLVLRQLLFRGRRALIILPYVSICSEKVAFLRRLWGPCGVRVEALYSTSGGYWHANADVAVCTIEKASTLLNRLLEEDALLRDIGVIVVDEMHLLGDDQRGYLLETVLVKARLSASTAISNGAGDHSLQIIGLSATLPNVNILAKWLDAHLHISDDRPVPLTIRTSAAAVQNSSARGRDPDGLFPLVRDPMTNGHSVLVFCATKDWCEKAAAMLAQELELAGGVTAQGNLAEPPKLTGDHRQISLNECNDQGVTAATVLEARLHVVEELRQSPAGLCKVLAKTLLQGVAYHHAGLTVEERSILEQAFRDSVISCLCATSTLAAGVNLPCRRVIIRSLRVGSSDLDATRFKQMAGRAGRAGFDEKGECIVMARGPKETSQSRQLLEAEMAPLKSALRGERLARAVLEVVALGMIRSASALQGSFGRSLLRFQEESLQTVSDNPSNADDAGCTCLSDDLEAALLYLESRHLIRIENAVCAPAGRVNASDDNVEGHGNGPSTDEQADTELCRPQPAENSGQGAGSSEPDRASDRLLMTTPLGDGVVDSSIKPDENSGEGAGSSEPDRASDRLLMTTPLGDGVVHSSIKPDEALGVFEDLQKARQGLRLDTELHLIYLATPASTGMEPDWQRYSALVQKLPRREKSVADAVGVCPHYLAQRALGGGRAPAPATGFRRRSAGTRGGRSGRPASRVVGEKQGSASGKEKAAGPADAFGGFLDRDRKELLHKRFYAALIIHELASEVPSQRVARKFGVARGALQSIQNLAATYCGMVRQLCERLRWHEMAALFASLEPRVSFGVVSAEALPLCTVPGVHAARCRALMQAGLTSIETLARSDPAVIEAALRRLHQFESHCTDAGAARRQEQVIRLAAVTISRGAQQRLTEQMQLLVDEAEKEEQCVPPLRA